jgi:hypothetical protein
MWGCNTGIWEFRGILGNLGCREFRVIRVYCLGNLGLLGFREFRGL